MIKMMDSILLKIHTSCWMPTICPVTFLSIRMVLLRWVDSSIWIRAKHWVELTNQSNWEMARSKSKIRRPKIKPLRSSETMLSRTAMIISTGWALTTLCLIFQIYRCAQTTRTTGTKTRGRSRAWQRVRKARTATWTSNRKDHLTVFHRDMALEWTHQWRIAKGARIKTEER